MTDNVANEEKPSWVIDIFRPEDAAGVVELYRMVYGDSYPVKTVYDPKELIREESAGAAYRVVARTAGGEVVGHVALYRSSPPNLNLYEIGQLMVKHDFRGADIASRLIGFISGEMPERCGLEQIWGEAVCNHLVTQQMAFWEGFYPMALEVDLMPAESYDKAFLRPLGNTGRVSTLVIFKTFKTRAQVIFLPKIYEQSLQYIYSACDFGHTYVQSRRGFADGTATKGKTDVFAAAGVARITLFEAGEDFPAYIKETERRITAEGAVVIQVYLPLSLPCAGAVVDVLRANGYFLGGPLPRWFDGDGLLMQKTLSAPNFGEVHLYRKQAKEILKIIKEDWQDVAR